MTNAAGCRAVPGLSGVVENLAALVAVGLALVVEYGVFRRDRR